jgi:hypothetical protein
VQVLPPVAYTPPYHLRFPPPTRLGKTLGVGFFSGVGVGGGAGAPRHNSYQCGPIWACTIGPVCSLLGPREHLHGWKKNTHTGFWVANFMGQQKKNFSSLLYIWGKKVFFSSLTFTIVCFFSHKLQNRSHHLLNF